MRALSYVHRDDVSNLWYNEVCQSCVAMNVPDRVLRLISVQHNRIGTPLIASNAMQFEKFNNPQPYNNFTETPHDTDALMKQKYANADTVSEIPIISPYSYIGNPCPGWHAPVNKRPDDIEASVKKWFTKCVLASFVALFFVWGFAIAIMLGWKVILMIWIMK